MNAKIKSLETWPNAVVTKLKNKKIEIWQSEKVNEKIFIKFRFATEDADKPACLHNCIKGKVRETTLCLSKEAMEALVISYMKQRKEQPNGFLNIYNYNPI